MKLSLVDIPHNLRAAIVGFHALTGNDYVSAIFQKSKRVCWKLIEKSRKFADMFARLGEEWIIHADLMRLLEEYICSLFSKGKKYLNMLRYEIFKRCMRNKENPGFVTSSTLPRHISVEKP